MLTKLYSSHIKEMFNLKDNENYIIFKGGRPVEQNILDVDGVTISLDERFNPIELCKIKRDDEEEKQIDKIKYSIFIDIYKNIDIKLFYIESKNNDYMVSFEIERELDVNITNVIIPCNDETMNVIFDYVINDAANVKINTFNNYNCEACVYNNYYLDYKATVKVNELSILNNRVNSKNKAYLYQEKGEIDVNYSIINDSGINQNYDWQIYHRVGNTKSNLVVYGVCNHGSNITVDTNGIISKNAKKSEAKQKSKGIVLDDASSISTSPWLQIDEYDVIANHGSSIGSVDEDDIFYLMSRGMDRSSAQELIINGFFNPYLSKVNDLKVLEFIKKVIKEHLK